MITASGTNNHSRTHQAQLPKSSARVQGRSHVECIHVRMNPYPAIHRSAILTTVSQRVATRIPPTHNAHRRRRRFGVHRIAPSQQSVAVGAAEKQ